MFNRWPGLLLTIALLFGLGVCFKRFDFLLMNEIKALISVVFGFATSCLLLSFIWLIQKRPKQTWRTEDVQNNEVPNMHPRGRSNSDVSIDDTRPLNISTVSSPNLDKPPNYEDALIYSRPINYSEKANEIYESNKSFLQSTSCTHPNVPQPTPSTNQCSSSWSIAEMCGKQTYDAPRYSNTTQAGNSNTPSSTSMAQFALNIVKGFASIEPSSIHQQSGRYRISLDNGYNHDSGTIYYDQHRQHKLSYCQLDVSQLVVLESPPRYCELSFITPESGNTNNEPGSGDRV